MNNNKSEPIFAHFQELRRRLLICLATVILGFAVNYNWADILLQKLAKPLDAALIFISPAEAFLAQIKLAVLAALVMACPIILWQLWGFIVPALTDNERKLGRVFIIGGTGAFWCGVFFAYKVVLPIGLNFLLKDRGLSLVPMIAVGEYISFVINVFAGMGLAFTLPLAVIVLSRLGILAPETLIRFRRYAWVIIFILAAIFTPPDVVSQILLGVPLLGLYELAIFLARTFKPNNSEAENAK